MLNGEEMLQNIFRAIGTKPETLTIANVLLRKGDTITVYVVPDRPRPFLSETEASADKADGESMYRVQITRAE